MSEYVNEESADQPDTGVVPEEENPLKVAHEDLPAVEESEEEEELQTLPDEVVAPEENFVKVAHEDLPVRSEEEAEAVGVAPEQAAETAAADTVEKDEDNG